jgi:hypothetical protein
MQTTTTRSRRDALPSDVAALLSRFDLSLDNLLTIGASNAKLAKGQDLAHSVILHHLPARSLAAALRGADQPTIPARSKLPGIAELARVNGVESLALAHDGCPWASKGCQAGCLAWSGHGGLTTTPAAARARRTLALIYNHKGYAVAVLIAIARQWRKAQAQGLPLAVRLRGTDDLPWHDLRFNLNDNEAAAIAHRYGLPVAPGIGTTIAECLSLAPKGTIQQYDYSKAPVHGPYGLIRQRAAGIDTTASMAADRPGNVAHCMDAIDHGFRLAVPVALKKGAPLPAALLLRNGDRLVRLQCVDGDVHDLRYLDPSGPQAGGYDGIAIMLRTKRSRGATAAADAFSLAPIVGQWQLLAGGGHAAFSNASWGF